VSQPRGSAALTLWLLLAACSSGDAVERDAAGRLVRSVQVLRDAPNEAKAPLLTALEQSACSGAEACSTRNICARAYRLHVDALALTEVAKARFASGKTPEATRLVMSAEAALREAKGKVSDCVDSEAALRRRYKL
jgi:hypothetical protein